MIEFSQSPVRVKLRRLCIYAYIQSLTSSFNFDGLNRKSLTTPIRVEQYSP